METRKGTHHHMRERRRGRRVHGSTSRRPVDALSVLIKHSVLDKAESTKREMEANAEIILREMGVVRALESVTVQERKIETDSHLPPTFDIGYMRKVDGGMLPVGTIRWKKEEKDFPFGKKVVSKAVSVTCNILENNTEIYYSAETEEEDQYGVRKRSVWKKLNEQGLRNVPLDAKIQVAMSYANGKMFEEN